VDAPAAAAIDRQKYGIEASPHEQKACIEKIKGDMSQLQVAMKDTVHVPRLIHDDVAKLKALDEQNACIEEIKGHVSFAGCNERYGLRAICYLLALAVLECCHILCSLNSSSEYARVGTVVLSRYPREARSIDDGLCGLESWHSSVSKFTHTVLLY